MVSKGYCCSRRNIFIRTEYIIYNICGYIYEIIISFQSELDTLAATLKQLENQKGEAQKRLNDLKAQVIIVGLERSFRLVFSALLLVADS